jgi:hypothetical protein
VLLTTKGFKDFVSKAPLGLTKPEFIPRHLLLVKAVAALYKPNKDRLNFGLGYP